MTEEQLLDAARDGDEDAFGALIETHRSALYAHCYRMLGSAEDADDALQDALLRAWRGLPRFRGGSPLRSWLYAIATNASLRAIERRPNRVLPIDYGPPSDPHEAPGAPLTESIWIDPLPDASLGPDAGYEQRETVELAFIAALQLLPARQRAVLILRDVLGFSGAEVAALLDTTPASVYSALQRAHRTVDARLPERSQQATLRALGDAELRAIVDGYVAAWERGDVDALATMLSDEATMSMPPIATWFRGRAAVLEFLTRRPLDGRLRWPSIQVRANGQLAFGHYRADPRDGSVTPHSISVVTLRGSQIDAITAFLEPQLFERFALGALPVAAPS
ncbi:MAG TPA: sigma-70 family RNA polymerase sigma factor [Solirubrobacteraceae bacterium]|jgi:RNA polymerase sigma-70 factor (ECF subfamily)|nr:sigma-70 family RNA polymerase sigma factor [Solirubrobacteraceae bacterium]